MIVGGEWYLLELYSLRFVFIGVLMEFWDFFCYSFFVLCVMYIGVLCKIIYGKVFLSKVKCEKLLDMMIFKVFFISNLCYIIENFFYNI